MSIQWTLLALLSFGAVESSNGDFWQTPRKKPSQLLSDAKQAYDEQDYQRAASLYSQVLKQQPKNVPALARRGCCYILMEQVNDGRRDVQQAMALDANHPEAQFAQGRLLYKTGDAFGAAQIFFRLAKKEKYDWELLMVTAHIGMRVRGEKHVDKLLEELKKDPSRKAEWHGLMCIKLLQGENPTKGVAHLKLALDLKPQSPELLVLASAIARGKGDMSSLRDYCQRGLLHWPRCVEFMFGLGIVHAEMGEQKKAQDIFERAQALCPERLEFTLLIVRSKMQALKEIDDEDTVRKVLTECEETVEKLVPKFPNSASVMATYCSCLRQQAKYKELIDAVSKYHKANSKDASLMLDQSFAYAANKQFAQAKKTLAEAISLPSAVHHHFEGAVRICGLIDDLDAASHVCRMASTRFPDSLRIFMMRQAVEDERKKRSF